MAILLFLLLILILLLQNQTTTTVPKPSQTSQPPSAFVVHFSETSPPSSPLTPPSHQLNKIIDALIGAGDFAGWANILSSTDPSTLPITATLFIPTNDAIATAANSTGVFLPDTFLIPYHIVPQRLTFDDLKKFPVLTKLPTLLPTKFIVVTNDSVENFTVDETRVTHPDLYLTGSFSVHGVMNVLDYVVYGNGVVLMENGTLARNETSNEVKGKPVRGDDESVVVSFGGWLGCDFWICVAVVYVIMMFLSGREFSDFEFWYCLLVALVLSVITFGM